MSFVSFCVFDILDKSGFNKQNYFVKYDMLFFATIIVCFKAIKYSIINLL